MCMAIVIKTWNAAHTKMLKHTDAATQESEHPAPPHQPPSACLEHLQANSKGGTRCSKYDVQASLRDFCTRQACGVWTEGRQWITRPIGGAQAGSLSTQLKAVGVRQGDGTFQGRLGAMWARRVQLEVAIARTSWWVSASV